MIYMCLNIPNVTTSATLCVREVLATVFVQIQVQGILYIRVIKCEFWR